VGLVEQVNLRTRNSKQWQDDVNPDRRAVLTTLGSLHVDDRFTVSGVLYRVTFVRPDRRIDTVAEAEAVE
jgi:hypothetical protein